MYYISFFTSNLEESLLAQAEDMLYCSDMQTQKRTGVTFLAPTEVQSLFTKLKNTYNKYPFFPLIVTGIAGAGHLKQAIILKNALKNYADIDAGMVVMDLSNNIPDRFYSAIQKYPKIMDAAENLGENPIFTPFIDPQTIRRAEETAILQYIKEKNTKALPVLFMSTYVTGAVVAARLLNSGVVNGGLIEYVPDPWANNALQAMTSPVKAQKHSVITHDEETRKKYLTLASRDSESTVWALGTLSSAEFLVQQKKPTFDPPHILVEFSGNENNPYTILVKRFIYSIQQAITSKELYLSIHSMQHKKTRLAIEKILVQLGIKNVENVKHYYKETLEDATQNRIDIITHNRNAPAINIRLGKGEVPLEHFSGFIYGIFGGGHERNNARIGELDKRGRSLIDIQPELWWQIIQQDIQDRPFASPQSHAVLAPALFFDHFGPFYEKI
jgi:hypothetical protein